MAPLLAHCRQDAQTKTWLIPETMPDARLLNMDWSNMLEIHPGANITAVVPVPQNFDDEGSSKEKTHVEDKGSGKGEPFVIGKKLDVKAVGKGNGKGKNHDEGKGKGKNLDDEGSDTGKNHDDSDDEGKGKKTRMSWTPYGESPSHLIGMIGGQRYPKTTSGSAEVEIRRHLDDLQGMYPSESESDVDDKCVQR